MDITAAPAAQENPPPGINWTIHPDRLYDVNELRVLLRPARPMHRDTVYRIPERLLPKTRVGGEMRGSTMWKGADILAYLEASKRRRGLKAVA